MNLPTVEKRTPYHPLAYAFIYFAFITGISFMVMSLMHDSTGITMYAVMNQALGFPGNFIWGALSVLSGCGTLWFYHTRKTYVATASATLGVGLWLFLGWLYISQTYWDGVLAAVIPNVWFWGWYYIETTWTKRVRRNATSKNGTWITSLWSKSRPKRL